MKVVLVEDSELIATEMLERLSRLPALAWVGHAAGEDEAVRLILDRQPEVVILDLRLSPGSGLEVLRRIRDAACPARVLVLTNFTHPRMRSACVQLGAEHFYDKHHQAQECLQMVATLALRQPGGVVAPFLVSEVAATAEPCND
ncbi:MAG: response regulator transcription factor [Curvibacter sp.]|nr:response regulator transcription factor [Curvibacter sp.]